MLHYLSKILIINIKQIDEKQSNKCHRILTFTWYISLTLRLCSLYILNKLKNTFD